MTELDDLIAKARQLEDQLNTVQEQLNRAEQAVLEKRFEGWERYQEGDIVLVPRPLFGEKRMWPAKVIRVDLSYSSGHFPENYKKNPGGFWESQFIAYRVQYRQPDGTFGGSSTSVYHENVEPYTGSES